MPPKTEQPADAPPPDHLQALLHLTAATNTRLDTLSNNMADLIHLLTTQRNNQPPPPPNPPPPSAHQPCPPKILLPNFDGSNPLDWLFQAKNYFSYYNIPPPQRISLAQFYFTGDALSWYKHLANNRLLGTWPEFSRALELRFGPSDYENHQASLFKLKQVTTVTAYQAAFEKLCNRVVRLSNEALLNCYISSLKQDIQTELAVLRPTTLYQAYGLSKLIEDKLGCSLISSSVSTPLSSVVQSAASSSQSPRNLPLLPVPVPSTTALPTARLSPMQLQQRRASGLCFCCPAKYQPGHKCDPPQFLLIADNELEAPHPPAPPPVNVLEEAPNLPHFLALSPATFYGIAPTTALRLMGFVNHKPVQILVDSGSTHNLIQPEVAADLHLLVQTAPSFPILIGNGDPLLCTGYCPDVPLTLDMASFKVKLFFCHSKASMLFSGSIGFVH